MNPPTKESPQPTVLITLPLKESRIITSSLLTRIAPSLSKEHMAFFTPLETNSLSLSTNSLEESIFLLKTSSIRSLIISPTCP